MRKQFNRATKIRLILAVLAAMCTGVMAQEVRIKGPVCIIPGITYQYEINSTTNDDTGIIQVCVTGGRMMTGGKCTPNIEKISSVRVIWDSAGQRKLDVRSTSGKAELLVQGTTELSGGLINKADKMQIYDSAQTTCVFHCDAAAGGSCTPVYVYQWQQSVGGLKWTNIEGANGKDLLFTPVIQATTKFRRVTTDTVSNTVAYSDIGILAIRFKPKQKN